MIHDHDGVYGAEFATRVDGLASRACARTPPSGPGERHRERGKRSLRREDLRHILPLNERHVRAVSAEFVSYHDREFIDRSDWRVHLPCHRPVDGKAVKLFWLVVRRLHRAQTLGSYDGPCLSDYVGVVLMPMSEPADLTADLVERRATRWAFLHWLLFVLLVAVLPLVVGGLSLAKRTPPNTLLDVFPKGEFLAPAYAISTAAFAQWLARQERFTIGPGTSILLWVVFLTILASLVSIWFLWLHDNDFLKEIQWNTGFVAKLTLGLLAWSAAIGAVSQFFFSVSTRAAPANPRLSSGGGRG